MKIFIAMVFVSISIFAEIREIHRNINNENPREAVRLREAEGYNENVRDYNQNQYDDNVNQENQEKIEAAQLRMEEKAAHDRAVDNANAKAEQKNKERAAAFDKRESPQAPVTQSQGVDKTTFNIEDYKDSAQLIIADQHLYGVTEVLPFKGDKILVKSVNGTFAFPIKLYESAQKINFGDVTTKDK